MKIKVMTDCNQRNREKTDCNQGNTEKLLRATEANLVDTGHHCLEVEEEIYGGKEREERTHGEKGRQERMMEMHGVHVILEAQEQMRPVGETVSQSFPRAEHTEFKWHNFESHVDPDSHCLIQLIVLVNTILRNNLRTVLV